MLKTKYIVGDKVICAVEVRKDGRKYILSHEPDPILKLSEVVAQIVSIHYAFEGAAPDYRIVVPDEIQGWQIGKFHILHDKVSSKFLGKHFWDVTEDYIIKKVKN